MFVIKSNFFGDFKLGDNVVRNMKALAALYDAKTGLNPESGRLMNKPIAITIASICEAILYDFNFRIHAFTREGVAGLPARIVYAVREKEYDELEQLIACSKKHDFFNGSYGNIYDDLTTLRKARNRIHIQNKKHDDPPDEFKLFTDDLVRKAEYCAEAIIKTMTTRHSRPPGPAACVEDLNIPWNEHLPRTLS